MLQCPSMSGVTGCKIKIFGASHLHCSLVLVEAMQRQVTVCHTVDAGVPETQQVVIAATGKIFAVRRPLQSTHFLRVFVQSANMVVSNSDIMVVNCSVATSTGIKPDNYFTLACTAWWLWCTQFSHAVICWSASPLLDTSYSVIL